MSDNRIVVYKGTGKVAVETLPYPKLEVPTEVADAMGISRKADHGVILKCVSTNICGSDQHMVRGRTTAPIGQTLGHEITGEVVEKGLTSSSWTSVTSVRCRLTSPVVGVATVARDRPGSV